ncbi:MAG TPA: TadE/TadG family type IV pilus assembly protein [Candidatus Cybelea sp.]
MIRRKNGTDSSGTSAMEFALLAPVFVFMLIGVIEVGRYMYFAILASHAARAGVQYASQSVETAADASVNGAGTRNAALADGQNLTQWTVHANILCTINGQASTCPQNTSNSVPANLVYYVEVKVSGTFTSLLHYPGIPNSFPMSATAIMPVSSQ